MRAGEGARAKRCPLSPPQVHGYCADDNPFTPGDFHAYAFSSCSKVGAHLLRETTGANGRPRLSPARDNRCQRPAAAAPCRYSVFRDVRQSRPVDDFAQRLGEHMQVSSPTRTAAPPRPVQREFEGACDDCAMRHLPC